VTGYNPELSNADYPTKRALLRKSHVELNRHFDGSETWAEQAIAQRGEQLAERAAQVWSDFTPAGLGADSEPVGGDEQPQDDVRLLIAEVLSRLGGEVERLGTASRLIYRTGDGKVVNVKYSKRHEEYYWFGLHASLRDEMDKIGVTHVAFILGTDSFVTIPIQVVRDYLADASSSPKSDGTVRHYHLLISLGPKPELFHFGKTGRIALKQYMTRFGNEATSVVA
jgi:hypothetical protein